MTSWSPVLICSQINAYNFSLFDSKTFSLLICCFTFSCFIQRLTSDLDSSLVRLECYFPSTSDLGSFKLLRIGIMSRAYSKLVRTWFFNLSMKVEKATLFAIFSYLRASTTPISSPPQVLQYMKLFVSQQILLHLSFSKKTQIADFAVFRETQMRKYYSLL